MNKHDLLHKIKSLENLSQDERAYLINLINTKKKYGLVWEDKPEDVEENLRENLPILKEVKDKALLNDEHFPNHILIEGDNLHGLTTLTFTHEGKIDAMYFDPPYNTGAKDWRYNNDYVEKEDSFKHSKWLSMIDKRLKIAKRLLKDDGVICVTIDDYEMPRLFILMEEIFGEENHLGTIVIRNNPSGRSTVKGVSITHEYAIFFGKSPASKVGRLPRNDKQKDRYDLFDPISPFEWVDFRKHGGNKKEAPSMYYPFYVTESSMRIPELEWKPVTKEWTILEQPKPNEKVLFPIDENGLDRRWKWGIDRVKNSPDEFCIKNDRTGQLGVYVKARMKEEGVLPLTWWDKKEYSATAYGTNFLKSIFGELQVFSYPKSIHAVVDCIRVLSSNPQALILDIFAGSGTSLHATMLLNAEDDGNRQCILVTNNENNICEEVTYVRNKLAIEGYTNDKDEHVPGLANNNLRYYKSVLVSRDPSIKNKRELTRLATELLCIKEVMYEEQRTIGEYQLNATYVRGFQKGNHYMLIIYDDEVIDQVVKVIEQTVKKSKGAKLHFKIYVFSNGQYPYTEEFEEVLPYVTLCALPDAIYKAYQNVLPKKHRAAIPQIEDEAITEE
jgi:adenine-specific DNA-methyltransferase